MDHIMIITFKIKYYLGYTRLKIITINRLKNKNKKLIKYEINRNIYSLSVIFYILFYDAYYLCLEKIYYQLKYLACCILIPWFEMISYSTMNK